MITQYLINKYISDSSDSDPSSDSNSSESEDDENDSKNDSSSSEDHTSTSSLARIAKKELEACGGYSSTPTAKRGNPVFKHTF